MKKITNITIVYLNHLLDIVAHKYDIYKEPNTDKRGHHRIDYIFCTEYIYSIINRCGITFFNEEISSDHRELFIDLRLQDFLNSYLSITNSYSRKIQSTN